MKLSTSLLAVLAPSAMGHYMFWQTIVGGAKSSNWQYIRETANNPTQAPVEDITSPLMGCYEKAGRAPAAVQTVSSGSRIGFTASSAVTHPGPSLFYMARVPDGQDVNSWSPSGNVWFKIDQHGAKSGSQFDLNMNEIYTTIPASLRAGNYLMRVEHVGLHSAGAPQFYISCAQLKVTGNGASTPTNLVAFPGAYSRSDSGLFGNIYVGAPAQYNYPGPAVWGGGGSGNNPPPEQPPANPSPTQPPTNTPSNPPTNPPTNPPSGNCAAMYGQCGGQGWSGATCCTSGSCTKSNDWYSQCL